AIVHGRLVTAEGRVLTVVGHGKSFSAAAAHAYEGVSQVFFEGMQFRHDIGYNGTAAEREPTP
ncbi:MAG: phosphoribosylamine--glycine ligase, partial [Acidobacteria bacterium]